MNILDIYDSYFSQHKQSIFRTISNIAYKYGIKMYLVGGIVRDMLLDVKSLDIDVIVEGNAIEFAKQLEKECDNVEVSSIHKDFMTAKVKFEGKSIDFASTRNETYPKAGHLPVVTEIGCKLKKDVPRRDFTINTLAMSLNRDDFGEIIDYYNGYEDLKNRTIKILHNKSFEDDPTRIIRGLKYATRLDFKLDTKTRLLQEKYLSNINHDMCKKRILQEFKKTFEKEEEKQALVWQEFIEQGIYKLINEDANTNIKLLYPHNSWLVYFGLLAPEKIDDFELTKPEQDIILEARRIINTHYQNDLQIYKEFKPQRIETLLIAASRGKGKEVEKYLNHFSGIDIEITGADLINLGLKPSKEFKDIFDYVIEQKLNSPHLTKCEELEIVKEYLTKQN